ncbi:MAG: DUF1501 domain-containing protein [Myxococcota bacterium]
MNRRDFLKLAGLAGLSVAAPLPWSGVARGQDQLYDGPLYLVVHASGGWDPTSLCDPKGSMTPDDPDPVNRYLRDDIRSPSGSSPIQWAPFGTNEAFFSRYYDRLLVLNGLDTSTNNHAVGPRHIHSGTLNEGHPAFAALVAAQNAGTSPLSFITYGGYDITRGVVSRTRLGNISAITRVAHPNRLDDDSIYHTEATLQRIRDAQSARLERLASRQLLPRLKRSLGTLRTARVSDNALVRLNDHLPDLDAFDTNIGEQGALAIAAWQAGLCVSANLSTGGFDTHGNHDVNQATALTRLTDGLVEILQHAENLGVDDRIILIVGSDFGRTPSYNDGNGKDHWPITSMLLMGPGIPGNTVIGHSDERHRALPINPDTLEPDDSGVILKPIHVQRALRKLAGVTNDDLVAGYPLVGEDLPLFG